MWQVAHESFMKDLNVSIVQRLEKFLHENENLARAMEEKFLAATFHKNQAVTIVTLSFDRVFMEVMDLYGCRRRSELVSGGVGANAVSLSLPLSYVSVLRPVRICMV